MPSDKPKPFDTPSSGPESPNWYVLILGLQLPERPLVLAPGVTLIPLPGPLSIFDMAAAGAAGFQAWSMIGQVAPRCTCEIESARDSDVTPGYDTLNRAWLASALLVLRGHGGLMPVAYSAYPWSSVAELRKQQADWFLRSLEERGLDIAMYGQNGELPRFRGDILDFHTQLLLIPSIRGDAPSADDATLCQSNFPRFNRLCAVSDKFRFALEAVIDWRYARDHRAAIARLWSGIEALFGVNAELVYRLSAYSAALLVARGSECTAKYYKVKRLYATRSKAVHGDKISDEHLTEGTAQSFELLRSLLIWAVEHDRVPTEADIDQAMFE